MTSPLTTKLAIIVWTTLAALSTRQLMVVLAGHGSLNLLRLMCKRHVRDLPGIMEVQEEAYVFLLGYPIVAGIGERVLHRDDGLTTGKKRE